MKYYSSVKRNRAPIHATTKTNIRNVMLSESVTGVGLMGHRLKGV